MWKPNSGRGGASLDELERVYRARFGDYQRVAAAIVGDAETARDAVQEAFVSAVRNRTRFRRDGPLDAWLWRAVVNAALNQHRSRARVVPPVEAGNGHVADAEEDVRLALALLPERQRLALFLRYYADLDYATIGAVLGVQYGTVGATLHFAHAALRRRFEEVRS
jgi:RNA polymerase sigma-70 factor, ECF subfamily